MSRCGLEELVQSGWSHADAVGYCQAYDTAGRNLGETGSVYGREAAEWRRLTGVEERRACLDRRAVEFRRLEAELVAGAPVSGAEPAAPGTPEFGARAIADAVAAKSSADAEWERAQRQAALPQAVVTDLPGQPSAMERRQWALRHAMTLNPPVIRPGGEQRVSVVFRMPDGTTKLVENVPPLKQMEVIRPGEWDAAQARWEFRQRWRENELLTATYGLERCLREGLVSDLDAKVMKLDQVTAVSQLAGVEAL